MNPSREHSLKKILRYAETGKLGAMDGNGCAYHTARRARFCAIGCLLTKKEHDMIDTLGIRANVKEAS